MKQAHGQVGARGERLGVGRVLGWTLLEETWDLRPK